MIKGIFKIFQPIGR